MQLPRPARAAAGIRPAAAAGSVRAEHSSAGGRRGRDAGAPGRPGRAHQRSPRRAERGGPRRRHREQKGRSHGLSVHSLRSEPEVRPPQGPRQWGRGSRLRASTFSSINQKDTLLPPRGAVSPAHQQDRASEPSPEPRPSPLTVIPVSPGVQATAPMLCPRGWRCLPPTGRHRADGETAGVAPPVRTSRGRSPARRPRGADAGFPTGRCISLGHGLPACPAAPASQGCRVGYLGLPRGNGSPPGINRQLPQLKGRWRFNSSPRAARRARGSVHTKGESWEARLVPCCLPPLTARAPRESPAPPSERAFRGLPQATPEPPWARLRGLHRHGLPSAPHGTPPAIPGPAAEQEAGAHHQQSY